MDKQIILVIEDTADEFGQNKLVVESDGNATYQIQSNHAFPESQELGHYATKLDEDSIQKINAVFNAPEFKSMPDHRGLVPPGEAVRRITFHKGDEEIDKFISISRTPPSYYEQVKNTILQVIQDVIKHPLRVIHIDVQWPKPPIEREKTSAVVINLSNRGTDKAVFANPFTKKLKDPSVLYIRAERSDIDLMAMRAYHYIHQEIKRATVEQTAGTVGLQQAYIELAPNTSLTFHLEVKFDWPPGKYVAQIVWEDYQNKEKPSTLIGVLYSSKHPTMVTGASKPGDEKLVPDTIDSAQ